jgi:hypothetical protein
VLELELELVHDDEVSELEESEVHEELVSELSEVSSIRDSHLAFANLAKLILVNGIPFSSFVSFFSMSSFNFGRISSIVGGISCE